MPLLQMPPEILLHIASYLRPRIEEVIKDLTPSDALEHMRGLRASLFNFSNTCSRSKQVLDPEVYRTVVIGRVYNQRHNEASSFLEILSRRREVKHWVKDLYLVLWPAGEGLSSFDSGQLQRLVCHVQDAQIQLPENFEKMPHVSKLRLCERVAVQMMLPCPVDQLRLAAAASVLFRVLRVKNLFIAASAGTISCISGLLKFYNATDDDRRCPNVSQPTSFTMHHAAGVLQRHQVDRDFLTAMNWRASDLRIEGLDVRLAPLDDAQPVPRFEQTTSLCLKNIYMDSSTFRYLLTLFPNLEMFKFFRASDGSFVSTAPSPIDMLNVMRQSHTRARLRTFCYDVTTAVRLSDRFLFDTFRDFEGLENLWLCDRDFVSAIVIERYVSLNGEEWTTSGPNRAPYLLWTLPKSLKRLHVTGRTSRLMEDMCWLAENCRDVGMTRLEEVAFGDQDAEDLRPAEKHLVEVERVAEVFGKIGVRCSRDVGRPNDW